jgi:hypothetical protein
MLLKEDEFGISEYFKVSLLHMRLDSFATHSTGHFTITCLFLLLICSSAAWLPT